MKDFIIALRVEGLKARRSKLWLVILAGFTILPLVSGLFMIILKDPDAAKEMGIISMKAQLTAGTADWPSMFGMLSMGASVAGIMLFSFITAWVFGREFMNHTAKELLALPIGRAVIVSAKLTVIVVWIMLMGLYIYFLGLLIGLWVDLPSWSGALALSEFWRFMLVVGLTAMLQPAVAFVASAGRGYLPPVGWAFFTLASANIMGVLGWGEYYPWTVPVLVTEMLGPQAEPLGLASYLSVLIACIVGLMACYRWWHKADQSH